MAAFFALRAEKILYNYLHQGAPTERGGLLNVFDSIGGVVLANACGPYIGQWTRHCKDPEKKNTIVISFNRNFAKRNDGNPNTHL